MNASDGESATVLIVEDDLPAQRRLVRLLRAHPAYREAQVRCADDVGGARLALQRETVHLMLLDLDLHGEDGFRVLAAAAESRTQVVVVSAHAHRAIEAYEVGVVDFVPKPVSEARLLLALGRARLDTTDRRPAELLVRTRQGLERVAPQDILYLRGADDYVELWLRSGRRLLHDESLAQLERRLPADFVRVHRSHMVRRDAVQCVLDGPVGTRVLQLSNGARVPVSRRRVAPVLRMLLGAQ